MNSPFRLPRQTPLGIGESIAEWVTGLSKLDNLYQQRPAGLSTKEFIRYTLGALGIEYQIDHGELTNIPATGSVVVVANHPLGGVEGVILAELLMQIRSDVKVLANYHLKRVSELDQLFIGVDVFEGKKAVRHNINAIREANDHLSDCGLLLVFPAGEVSTFDNRQLKDKKWSRSVAKFIAKSQATTIPVYVDGRNSSAFYLAGRVHPILRTLMLGRELLNKNEQMVNIAIGEPIHYSELKRLANDTEVVNYLRLNTYLLSNKPHTKQKPDTVKAKQLSQIAVIAPVDSTILQAEIAMLKSDELISQGTFSVYCTQTSNIPNLINEIGRIREITFREVGEGTGTSCDIDHYDECYYQLFIWNHQENELVGAYRIGLVDQLIEQKGLKGLYSRSLFNYDQQFIDQLGYSMELGRSVIAKKYQGSLTSLLLLWKGISSFVAKHPKYTHLFGPVSISSDYSLLARQLLASTLTVSHYDEDKAALVSPRQPLKTDKGTFWKSDMLSSLAEMQLLSKVLARMGEDKGVPVLLRQYLGLNGKLVCFNVDPAFNDALDGLIVVNLANVPHKTLSRYMGKLQAKQYLDFHQK